MCALILLYTGISVLPQEIKPLFLRENGGVETATLFAYVWCLVLIWRFGGINWIRSYWYLTVLILLLFLREADMHKRFTGHSIFGTRLYFHEDTTLLSIVVGLGVVVLVVVVLYRALSTHLGKLFKSLAEGSANAVFLMLAFILAIFAKLIDGIARPLEKMGIVLDSGAEYRFMQIEEIAELGIPLALCLATVKYFSKQDHDQMDGSAGRPEQA